jgi:hypothetical protein
MGKAAKQSERGSAKKATKQVEEESAADGTFLEAAKALAMSSCIVQVAPKIQAIIQEVKEWKENGFVVPAAPAPDKPAEEKEESEDNTQPEADNATEKPGEVETTASVFEALGNRLAWSNGLGLFASAEEGKKALLVIKGQEIDFGPRAKRTGSPGLERISANAQNNMALYMYAVFALMVLRSFLFRSFFACLPWLFGYQFLSMALPLTNLAKLPQVPLEKVPVCVRVLITLLLHVLVWLFFLYEAVWKCYFSEKFLLMGFVLFHSYAARPAEKTA